MRKIAQMLGFLLCIPVFAQTGPGSIKGRVSDGSQGVSGAPIEAKNVDTGTIYKTTSSAGGDFSIASLQPGKYEITIGVSGFEKKEAIVQAAQTSNIDFHFQADF